MLRTTVYRLIALDKSRGVEKLICKGKQQQESAFKAQNYRQVADTRHRQTDKQHIQATDMKTNSGYKEQTYRHAVDSSHRQTDE